MRSLDWRQDKDYLDYNDSGESAAIYSQKYRKIIRYKKHVGRCRINEYLLQKRLWEYCVQLDHCGVVSAENKTKV